MERHKIIYTLLSLFVVFVGSCENKWPNNGDLDGMWQLMSIEQNNTVTSLKDTKHYWSIRANLIQFSNYANTVDTKYCHFECKENKLILTDFCHKSLNAVETDNDEWITSEERSILNQWGIYPQIDTEHQERLTQSFNIDVLSNENLIISTDSLTLTFRKF